MLFLIANPHWALTQPISTLLTALSVRRQSGPAARHRRAVALVFTGASAVQDTAALQDYLDDHGRQVKARRDGEAPAEQAGGGGGPAKL